MPATFAMHGLSLAIGARAVQKLAALESSEEPAQYAERGRRILRLDVSTLSAAMMAAQVLMWKGRVHWHGALTDRLLHDCMGLKMLCEQSFHVGDMKHVTTRYTLRELLAGENRACELLLGANRCGITPCSPLRHVNIFRSMLCALLLESTQANRARARLHPPKPPVMGFALSLGGLWADTRFSERYTRRTLP